jgi:hypothetical protein
MRTSIKELLMLHLLNKGKSDALRAMILKELLRNE